MISVRLAYVAGHTCMLSQMQSGFVRGQLLQESWNVLGLQHHFKCFKIISSLFCPRLSLANVLQISALYLKLHLPVLTNIPVSNWKAG